jgi:hypothetical protein
MGCNPRFCSEEMVALHLCYNRYLWNELVVYKNSTAQKYFMMCQSMKKLPVINYPVIVIRERKRKQLASNAEVRKCNLYTRI